MLTDKELQLFRVELADDNTWAFAVWMASYDYYTNEKEMSFIGICNFDTYGECLLEMDYIIKHVELDE